MTPADENHFTVLLPAEISPPVFAWAATFGKGMKILGPQPAVDGMKDFLEKALEMYKDEDDKGFPYSFQGCARVFIHVDFTLQNRPLPFTEKCEKGSGLVLRT